MASEQLAKVATAIEPRGASVIFAERVGMKIDMAIDTVKAQCFLGVRPDEISDMQLAAFISVSNALQVNPLIPGMLYAYPNKQTGAIVPILGPDGLMMKLDNLIKAGELDGYECEVFPADVTVKPTHATATIWRKNTDRPAKYTAIFKEWYVGNNPNWNNRERHMIWLRALKQCARQVIHGLPMDEDERKIAEMNNVTNSVNEPITDRPTPPVRETAGAAPVAETTVLPEKTEVKAEVKKETAKGQSKAKAEKTNIVEGNFTDATTVAEVVKEKAAPLPEAKQKLTSLTPDQRGVFLCKILSVKPDLLKVQGVEHAGVIAEVDGEFKGTVYDTNGAVFGEPIDGKPTVGMVKPVWTEEGDIRLSLWGKQGKKSVIIMVEKAESVEQTAAEDGEALD